MADIYMGAPIRNMIQDYLNTGDSTTPVWSLCGRYFTQLDESPAAQVDTKAYINDKTTSSTITGYQTVFPFTIEAGWSEEAIQEIYWIGTRQAQSGKAERDYIRTELFIPVTGNGAMSHPARKFRVAVEVSDVSGAGAQVITGSGNFHSVGDFTEGIFDVETKVFTPGAFDYKTGTFTPEGETDPVAPVAPVGP